MRPLSSNEDLRVELTLIKYRSNMYKHIILWLFIIFLGVSFGAGIYESRIVIPQWINIPTDQWPNTGLLFWVYVTTIPLTLLTILNAISAWRECSSIRSWWLSAVLLISIERIATFSYFIPGMIQLMSQSLPEAEIATKLTEWMLLNHGRHLLTFAGWMFAMKAFSMQKL